MVSKSFFHSRYENSFHVSPDGETLVGILHSSLCNSLVMERITDKTLDPLVFGNHSKRVYTLFPNKKFDLLLAGDYEGRVVQYRMNYQKLKYSVQHCYQDVGVDIVFSSVILGSLAVVGGSSSRIRLIDIDKKEYLSMPFETAINHIFTLKLCQVSDLVYLAIGGDHADYSESKSDLLDLSDWKSIAYDFII